MKDLQYTVKNSLGIHARPAALLAQACTNFKSAVMIECNGNVASGNNVLQILALHAAKGSVLNITADGPDEEEAICCEDEECPCEKECNPPCPSHPKKDKGDSGLISFLEGLKSEELLLIALIVLLCTKDGGQGLDTVLILALLLCM